MNLIQNLDANKTPESDGISNWILRECCNQLVDKIYCLISLSLLQGKTPKDWKRANIVPVYEGGNKEDPLNYRPASLLSVVGKLCERIVKDKWVEYLEKNRVVTVHQHGFQRGSSCSSNLMAFYTKIIDTVQEREGWEDAVYCTWT